MTTTKLHININFKEEDMHDSFIPDERNNIRSMRYVCLLDSLHVEEENVRNRKNYLHIEVLRYVITSILHILGFARNGRLRIVQEQYKSQWVIFGPAHR